MSIFTNDYISFFKELSENNEKSWFDEHRKQYETHVKKTFNHFLDQLIEAINRVDPEIDIHPKEAVFRINRDIRFSKNKTPYKIHMAAVISRHGRKNLQTPGIYIQISANDFYIGGGSHSPDKNELHAIRQYLIDHYDELVELSQDDQFKKMCGPILGEKNKVLPKEFKDFAASHEMMFNKQFYFMKHYPVKDILFKKDLIEFIVGHYLVSKPFNDFLNRARYVKK